MSQHSGVAVDKLSSSSSLLLQQTVSPTRFPRFVSPAPLRSDGSFAPDCSMMELFVPLTVFVEGAKGWGQLNPLQVNLSEHYRRLMQLFCLVTSDFVSRDTRHESTAVIVTYESVRNKSGLVVAFRLRLMLTDTSGSCAGKIIEQKLTDLKAINH